MLFRSSPFDLARYGDIKDDDPNQKSASSFGIGKGGWGASALQRVQEVAKYYVTEQCAPFSQIVNKSTSYEQNVKLLEGSWNRLHNLYDSYKKKQDCPTCLTEITATAKDKISQDFDLKASNEQILKAFAEDTYEKFLDKLLIPEQCRDPKKMMIVSTNLKTHSFPPDNTTSNFSDASKILIDTLKKDIPVQMGFCMDDQFQSYKNCKNAHSVVISGFRKFCKSPDDCRISLKVQNSWGQQWQDKNDGGWVDAKTILDRTSYSQNTLSWLE